MERINLYRYKKPVLKLSSFLILVVALLAPVFAARFTVEFYKQTAVNALNSSHAVILSKYKLTIKLPALQDQYLEIKRLNDLLHVESKRLQDRISLFENHLYEYAVTNAALKTLLNNWKKDDENWLILTRLLMDQKNLVLNFHEIYLSNVNAVYNNLAELLSQYYRISKAVDYETTVPFLNKKLAKVTINGSR
ncbi:hypothetical protein [Pseudothermotoga thermarum]|uniref:Uncharacterized protein n=1 Tax=Pseudothermotoga thermarum DSM 5069 TaxID=688269 RepID=F7YYE0_9THEM|nr:hypothetical protein [Pseudothermotoga thermarum]AEH50964.1 hypothetical protein Theth_0880 [Pseudothermotoga thermarum DSM 5069]